LEAQGIDDKAQSMFGNDLASQVRADGGSLPLLVKECIEAVEQRGKIYCVCEIRNPAHIRVRVFILIGLFRSRL
jgi:hypothetical protein